MAKNDSVFHTLTNFGEAYKTKKDKTEVHAQMQAFVAKDSEVRQVKDSSSYVVSTFTNLSGAKADLDKIFGLDLKEDENYKTIPAGISWFTNTKEEAEAIQAKLVKGSRLSATVSISTRPADNGQVYIDLRIDQPFIAAPQGRGVAAETGSGKGESKDNPMELSDDDLPF